MGDRLFHTLDPTTRSYEHDGRQYLVTDTVGFIRKLPHQLVEAFKATLEETRIADLILHVVDGSDDAEQRAAAIAAVDSALAEIGASDQPRLLVFNKIDLLDDGAASRPPPRPSRTRSASRPQRGEGIDELRDRIETAFADTLEEVELLVPYADGGRLSELYEIAGDLERDERSDGVRVSARIPRAARASLRRVRGRHRRLTARGTALPATVGGGPAADPRARWRRRVSISTRPKR